MIVRVQGSGQYKLADSAVGGLNSLDSDLLTAVQRQDAQGATATLYKMIEFVQTEGEAVNDDELLPSDAILPPDDVTYDELIGVLRADGLIPG